MHNVFLIDQNLDVSQLAFELHRQPELWNQDRERTDSEQSPHHGSDDIWIRYNDKTPFIEKGSMDGFNDPHFPVWYPAYYALPALKPIIALLMAAVNGEHLGGVLMIRVKPGHAIKSHIDLGWHAGFYDKFNICIKGKPGANFNWLESGDVMPGRTGDVYQFTNNTPHEVVNDSDEDLILLCVCIRTHHYAPIKAVVPCANSANPIQIKHHFPTDGNQVYIREMTATAGYAIGSHKHKYEHYSILSKGMVSVEIDGEATLYQAPSVLRIAANVVHKITSVTDFTWFCIHHTDHDDESTIDDVLINRG